MEAINFVVALEGRVRVKVKVTNPSECVEELGKIDLALESRQTMLRLMVILPDAQEGVLVCLVHVFSNARLLRAATL